MKMLSRDAAAEPEGPDDAELIERSRADDSSAYEVLYERHAEAARRLAHRLARDRDRADDLVAEAFTRVLSALRRGKGPDLAFRPYLLTVVRNIAIEWANGDKRLMLVDGYDALEHPSSDDDPVVAGAERGMAAQAFSELPERWQAVLWHTEVEGDSPAGIAPLLGLSPNAVAALAVRAREGLRQGYLQAHLSGDVPDECRDHAEGLARYTRGRLVRRKSAELRQHLDQCARCSDLYAELVQANTGLGALIGFAVLGPLGAVYGIAKGSFGAGVFGVWLARLRPRGSTGQAAAAGAAVVVIAAGAFAGIRLASDDSPAHRTSVAQGAAPGQNNGGGGGPNSGGNNGGGGPNSGGHNGGNGGNPGNSGGGPGGGNPAGGNPGGANPGGSNPGGGNPAGGPNQPSKHKPAPGVPNPGKPGNPGGPSSTNPPSAPAPTGPSTQPTGGLPTGGLPSGGPSLPTGTPSSPGTPSTSPTGGVPSPSPSGSLPGLPSNGLPTAPAPIPVPTNLTPTGTTIPIPGTPGSPSPSTSSPVTPPSLPTPGTTSPASGPGKTATPAPTPSTASPSPSSSCSISSLLSCFGG